MRSHDPVQVARVIPYRVGQNAMHFFASNLIEHDVSSVSMGGGVSAPPPQLPFYQRGVRASCVNCTEMFIA